MFLLFTCSTDMWWLKVTRKHVMRGEPRGEEQALWDFFLIDFSCIKSHVSQPQQKITTRQSYAKSDLSSVSDWVSLQSRWLRQLESSSKYLIWISESQTPHEWEKWQSSRAWANLRILSTTTLLFSLSSTMWTLVIWSWNLQITRRKGAQKIFPLAAATLTSTCAKKMHASILYI